MSSALQRAREWLGFKCDGDAMRCMDGNGCECAMAGKLPAPSADEALRALVAEIDAAPCPRVEGMPGTANGYGLMVTSKELVGQRVRLLTEAPGHGE